MLVERERIEGIIKAAVLLHVMYFFWYIFCALLLVLLPVGPFIHICSDFFLSGFHYSFLNLHLLSFILVFPSCKILRFLKFRITLLALDFANQSSGNNNENTVGGHFIIMVDGIPTEKIIFKIHFNSF